MDLLINMTVKDFNDLLASSEPAPGGGSTAALASLLGTALTMMVGNLSFGKKSYEALDESIKANVRADFDFVKGLNEELQGLVDEDTKAFNVFMEAMKMPKETDREKEIRSKALDKAGIYALEIPLRVAEKSLLILRHQSVIARYGNKNAISDIGVGALLAFAGLEGAVLNVKINLPGIADETIKADAKAKIESFVKEGASLKADILKIVEERIG
ncbi:MAG: cyclodeaminase/cyclohydrolase family protein [Eubacteriales bacterium]|nr:cyclodeaminase/cyclohydrolase family protein [Eubacteriales bacterium]